jgi:outer membrane immunogenic protein
MRVIFAGAAAAVLLAAASTAALAQDAGSYDWNGFYAGLNLGYISAGSTASYDYAPYATLAGPLDASAAGWAGGVQLGVNQVVGNGIVVGVEGDLDYGNVSSRQDDVLGNLHHAVTDTYYVTTRTDFSGTIRGRVGFDAGQLMPYLTAGVAAAHTTLHADDGDLTDSATLFGWTAGAGVEFAVASNVSLKAEYLYTDLGSHTYFPNELYSSTAHTTSNAVRVGVNFKFN